VSDHAIGTNEVETDEEEVAGHLCPVFRSVGIIRASQQPGFAVAFLHFVQVWERLYRERRRMGANGQGGGSVAQWLIYDRSCTVMVVVQG